MVVVKTRAVAEDEIAFDFDVTQFPLSVLREIIRFVGVLAQVIDVEAAHVGVRIFAFVIPAHPDAGFGGAAHQGDGFRHHVQVLRVVAGNADFCFDAELNHEK